MNKNEMEYKIDRAISSITPDIFDKVVKTEETNYKGEINFMNKTKKSNIGISMSIAACVALLICSGVTYDNMFREHSVIGIDVNPSIELSLNKNEKVLSAKALNEDAKIVLDGLKLKNLEDDEAIEVIVSAMVEHKYLSASNSDILITVENDDIEKAGEINETVMISVEEALADKDIDANIITQEVERKHVKVTEELADELDISYGKASLLISSLDKNNELTKEQFNEMTVDEIEDYYEDLFEDDDNDDNDDDDNDDLNDDSNDNDDDDDVDDDDNDDDDLDDDDTDDLDDDSSDDDVDDDNDDDDDSDDDDDNDDVDDLDNDDNDDLDDDSNDDDDDDNDDDDNDDDDNDDDDSDDDDSDDDDDDDDDDNDDDDDGDLDD